MSGVVYETGPSAAAVKAFRAAAYASAMVSRAAVLRETAARCARGAPQMPLDAVAETVGVDVHRLARYLRSRPRRGRCAEIAATVSEHKKFGQAAIAHPAAAPSLTRSAWWTLDADLRHAAGSAAAGTADWAARTRLRGLKRGLPETERLPRTAIVRVAAASDAAEMIYDRTELALNESCPPAVLAALSDTDEEMVRKRRRVQLCRSAPHKRRRPGLPICCCEQSAMAPRSGSVVRRVRGLADPPRRCVASGRGRRHVEVPRSRLHHSGAGRRGREPQLPSQRSA